MYTSWLALLFNAMYYIPFGHTPHPFEQYHLSDSGRSVALRRCRCGLIQYKCILLYNVSVLLY